MGKIDESNNETKQIRVVLGLENATLEQRLVFQGVVAPEMLKVLDQYVGLLAVAPDAIKVIAEPKESV
jgi:hypothetical protein